MQFLLPGMHHYSWWGKDTLAGLTGGLICLGAFRGLQGQFDIMLLSQVSWARCSVVMGRLQSGEQLETFEMEENPWTLLCWWWEHLWGALSRAHVFRSAAMYSAGAHSGNRVTSHAWKIVSWMHRLPIVPAIAKAAWFECISLPFWVPVPGRLGLKQIPPAAPATTRLFCSCFSSDIMQPLGKRNCLGSTTAWEAEPAGGEAAKCSQECSLQSRLWSAQLLLSQHKGYLCMFITKIKLQLLKAVICTWGNIMFAFSYCRDCTKAHWQRSGSVWDDDSRQQTAFGGY